MHRIDMRALFGAHGVVLLLLAAALPAAATEFVETFEGGSNTGGWSFHGPNEQIRATGGNPGAHLHTTDLDTFAPHPGTTLPSIFSGDLRAAGVSEIGVDLITLHVDFSAEGRPLTLMFISENGTPFDPDDDWAAYTMGSNIPLPGEGWKSYDFDVPSNATSLPPGWRTIPFGPNSPNDPDWNDVITDVASCGFFYGDPEMFFIFQMWELGLDNPRISYLDPGDVESPPLAGDAPALLRVAPNPAAGPVTIMLRHPEIGNGELSVHAADGRELASWPIPSGAGRVSSFDWEGRDADGRSVPAGVYFVRARIGAERFGWSFVRLAD